MRVDWNDLCWVKRSHWRGTYSDLIYPTFKVSAILPSKFGLCRVDVAKCVDELVVNEVLNEIAGWFAVISSWRVVWDFVQLWVRYWVEVACDNCAPLFGVCFCDEWFDDVKGLLPLLRRWYWIVNSNNSEMFVVWKKQIYRNCPSQVWTLYTLYEMLFFIETPMPCSLC